MSETIGWYYLHINGDLIFKREVGDTVAELREDPFTVMLWPVKPGDREAAWSILIEALSLGAKESRIQGLVILWKCTDENAYEYANRIGVRLVKDGDAWCATRVDFVDLQESPAGFGDTCLEAMAGLCKDLGYRPQKTWGTTFKDLVNTVHPGPECFKCEKNCMDPEEACPDSEEVGKE